MHQFTFDSVPSKVNFALNEEEILLFWKKIDAFKKSLRMSKDKKRFSFYDGPPFATGLPHYGHILAGTIKDVVTRFAHQTGHHVERRFGWDTHGLPVEFEIDKKLGVQCREDVLKMGIANYNAACRDIVMRYSREWREIVTRCGRWIDFDNDYKTLDTSFMESVWWVFKTVFDKGLIYRGCKIMPFSTRLGTPLSNFEANLNYKDVSDPAIVVAFPLKNDPQTSLLIWTTTPWTLPSNLAVCVRSTMDYVHIRDLKTGKQYILAASRLVQMYKKPKEGSDYSLLANFKGSELNGKQYEPPFDFFKEAFGKKAFRVLCDDYVTDKSGTGVVHQAPGFGEDDYRVCLRSGIIEKDAEVLCPVDINGRFTEDVGEFKGLYVKDADRAIIRRLRETNKLVKESQFYHSYPFCWRSDTPLIYRAVPSWFLDVKEIKQRLIANTKETYWVPDYVKSKRFMNWLNDACDWAISRSRFWGTPLPVWSDTEFNELIVVGSVEELERLSGVKGITDLHRENVDHILIPSRRGGSPLRRVDEVFDCWFESGSMPYAQVHYPFENVETFNQSFPADFIAEGLDQTRGWFYTLMVLSTALFHKPAFKNLICNGLVLAEDGKKMSKRLQNYPSPSSILSKYGADALRIYLINSPVVRAESLRFSENGVFEVVKDVFLLWYNTYRFFVENASRFEKLNKEPFVSDFDVFSKSGNKFDLWICASLQTLIEQVRINMKEYKLYLVTPALVKFLNQLSLWYVRFNRERMKGAFGPEEARLSLQTLHLALFSLCRLMAPFTPFLAESMYQNLKRCFSESSPFLSESVHFLSIPKSMEKAKNVLIERAISRLQKVIELGRNVRETKNVMFKQPLSEMTVVNPDPEYLQDLKEFVPFLKKDLNVHNVRFSSNLADFMSLRCVPNHRSLGKRLKKKASSVSKAVAELTQSQIEELREKGEIMVCEEILFIDDVAIEMVQKGEIDKIGSASGDGGCVVINTEITQDLREEGLSRECASFIQKLKKQLSLDPTAAVSLFYEADEVLSEVINRFQSRIQSQIGQTLVKVNVFDEFLKGKAVVIGEGTKTIGNCSFRVLISKQTIIFSTALNQQAKSDDKTRICLQYLASRNFNELKKEADEKGELRVNVYETGEMKLRKGIDFFFEVTEVDK